MNEQYFIFRKSKLNFFQRLFSKKFIILGVSDRHIFEDGDVIRTINGIVFYYLGVKINDKDSIYFIDRYNLFEKFTEISENDYIKNIRKQKLKRINGKV